MRFANIGGRSSVRQGDGYVDLAEASNGLLPADPVDALLRWEEIRAWVDRGGLNGAVSRKPRNEEMLAPSPRPRQIFAVGLNYSAHADETGLAGSEKIPLTFTKYASSIAGPYGELHLSGNSVDWEVELVVVIGRECRAVPRQDAWSVVAGVTVGQDFSDRDVQMTGTPPQFSLGKSFPGFSPIGPEIVTVDSRDGAIFELECLINGEPVQQGSTANLIHSIPDLIAAYSNVCTLYPGDLIFTGTPHGVGMGHTPPIYLKDGDRVVTRIAGVGEMVHDCVASQESETESK